MSWPARSWIAVSTRERTLSGPGSADAEDSFTVLFGYFIVKNSFVDHSIYLICTNYRNQ